MTLEELPPKEPKLLNPNHESRITNHEPLIFELGAPGKKGYSLPSLDVPVKPIEQIIPQKHLRKKPAALPEVSELEVVRHFTRLSQLNFSIDTNFYPLGSCTMKYNPKVNEKLVSLPGFAEIHPYQPEETVQGTLALLYDLEKLLCQIAGMAAFTLQPSAGAHGEFTGLLVIRAYHVSQGNARKKIIVPDSAHGTNPATAALLGYEVVQIPTNKRGMVDLDALKATMTEEVAALMLTNPSTLGIFEEEIKEIAQVVHAKGGILYYDGANLNALLGRCRPGDMGFDVVHINVHKTFTQPHGGGGPGAGPVGVSQRLAKFLPVPRIEKNGGRYTLVHCDGDSIGRARTFLASTGVMVRTYSYIRANGREGLLKVSEHAVLNANYLLAKLRRHFDVPYNVKICMHEFVLSGSRQKAKGVKTLDMAKRLLDYGCYAPTIYFPLIVDEAIMIEPTETESKETLDYFVTIVETILKEIESDPKLVSQAPHTTPVSRLDEVTAARKPVLRFRPT